MLPPCPCHRGVVVLGLLVPRDVGGGLLLAAPDGVPCDPPASDGALLAAPDDA